mmetsp:Transcript_12167/g.12008  ORF Transcript_12167/g.12008 Transcript_12167/m.12008 type:complete len:126 (-) Transcript_12167:230-607(-)
MLHPQEVQVLLVLLLKLLHVVLSFELPFILLPPSEGQHLDFLLKFAYLVLEFFLKLFHLPLSLVLIFCFLHFLKLELVLLVKYLPFSLEDGGLQHLDLILESCQLRIIIIQLHSIKLFFVVDVLG